MQKPTPKQLAVARDMLTVLDAYAREDPRWGLCQADALRALLAYAEADEKPAQQEGATVYGNTAEPVPGAEVKQVFDPRPAISIDSRADRNEVLAQVEKMNDSLGATVVSLSRPADVAAESAGKAKSPRDCSPTPKQLAEFIARDSSLSEEREISAAFGFLEDLRRHYRRIGVPFPRHTIWIVLQQLAREGWKW